MIWKYKINYADIKFKLKQAILESVQANFLENKNKLIKTTKYRSLTYLKIIIKDDFVNFAINIIKNLRRKVKFNLN